MLKTCLGLGLMLMPAVFWCAAIGYLLGFKVTLILMLIIPVIVLSLVCKILGKVILSS